MKTIKLILSSFLLLCSLSAYAAPEKHYDNQWITYNPKSMQSIDYSVWQSFLSKYSTEDNGQSYVHYGKVTKQDKQALENSIQKLTSLHIGDYNRNQQLAYWINLYNMETVLVILDNYPVSSITKINKGLFASGPWNEKSMTVNGNKISLNDIEHHIIRPIWNDPRIHAAVNCASIGCPNLRTTAYTGKDIDTELDQAFSEFVNSNKGVEINSGGEVYLSKIFDWYQIDFGNNTNDTKNFISYYLKNNDNKTTLLNAKSIYYQEYNWSLNEN